LFLPLPFLAGCRSNTGKLESEIRTRDQMVREALEEQRRMEADNIHLRQELDALRHSHAKNPDMPPSSFGVKRIVLNRATGGVDQDTTPGEELLQVVVEPRDSEDRAFRAPGLLQLYVLEITPQGIKTPLSMWEIPPDQLAPNWKSGLLGVGYTLTLPWKVLPVHENLRIIVRFVTPDQRAYEADRDIKVRLVPGALQKRPPMIPEHIPMPHPAPGHEAGPILLPTSQTSSWRREPAENPAPAQTQWVPGVPAPTITVGRPQPLER
jgi:hypothetical protein